MKTATAKKIWMGSTPETCNLCPAKITNDFIDGRISEGHSWAIMCPSCHVVYGAGLGEGLGQQYRRRGDEFVKVGG